MSAFDDLIANAPDEADEPDEPEPVKAADPAPEETPEAVVDEDTFYKDPLIQSALEKFEAKIVTN